MEGGENPEFDNKLLGTLWEYADKLLLDPRPLGVSDEISWDGAKLFLRGCRTASLPDKPKHKIRFVVAKKQLHRYRMTLAQRSMVRPLTERLQILLKEGLTGNNNSKFFEEGTSIIHKLIPAGYLTREEGETVLQKLR
jgi:hypothetical protein